MFDREGTRYEIASLVSQIYKEIVGNIQDDEIRLLADSAGESDEALFSTILSIFGDRTDKVLFQAASAAYKEVKWGFDNQLYKLQTYNAEAWIDLCGAVAVILEHAINNDDEDLDELKRMLEEMIYYCAEIKLVAATEDDTENC